MSQPRSAQVVGADRIDHDPGDGFLEALSPTARQILDVSATQLSEAREAIADGDVSGAMALYASVIPIHWGPLYDLRTALGRSDDVAALGAMGDVAALMVDLMVLAGAPTLGVNA